MSVDPTPNSPPDAKAAPLGAPVAAAGPASRLRRKRPWLKRLLTGRHYDDEVVVYRHSHLFYWWPVWLLGFIFAGVSFYYDHHMAILPADAEWVAHRKVELKDGTLKDRAVIILPEGKQLPSRKDFEGNEFVLKPFVAPHRLIGTIFLFVLLLVVVLTNISMRGLWSVLVLLILVLTVVILYLASALGTIFRGVGLLSIYINMGGYFLLATVLFILWAFNFFFLDRMTYMIFTPGQVRVRLTIGGGESVYDATNMTVQKQRADSVPPLGPRLRLRRPAGVARQRPSTDRPAECAACRPHRPRD